MPPTCLGLGPTGSDAVRTLAIRAHPDAIAIDTSHEYREVREEGGGAEDLICSVEAGHRVSKKTLSLRRHIRFSRPASNRWGAISEMVIKEHLMLWERRFSKGCSTILVAFKATRSWHLELAFGVGLHMVFFNVAQIASSLRDN